MAAIDVVSFGETMLRLTAPSTVRLENASSLNVYVAGTESNTLACLARMQLNVAWISALPTNPMGRYVDNELRRHGVDTSHVVWANDSSRVGTFYVEEAASPLGTQVYYDRAHSACALIDSDAVDLSIVDKSRLLHLTGITPALSERTRELFQRLLHRAYSSHISLSFDVNYRAKLWSAREAAVAIEKACQQASVLLCTRADAVELWGFTGSPETILHQMAAHFGETNKTYILTLGSEGAAQLQDGVYTTAAAFPTEGTSRFGSGDAFAAGYLYAYLNGSLYQEMRETQGLTALVFGNACAALKRCIQGDIAVINPHEVKALLERQDGVRFR